MRFETDIERIEMDKESLNELCEDSWGVSLDMIVGMMREGNVLDSVGFEKSGELSGEEKVVKFFVEMVNNI
tara:strand:- start:497 stop:709 length:213 start_codon:yes stop_codon:yes gene_type:complete